MGSATITRVVKFLRRGNGIQSVTEYYLVTSASSGVTTGTSGWTTSMQTPTAAKKYLWNYEVTAFDDGELKTTAPHIVGVFGKDGRGVSSIVEYYLATSAASGVTIHASGWTSTAQAMTSTKKYLWNYETVHYDDGQSENSTPRIIGVYGDKGDPGEPGEPGSPGQRGSRGPALRGPQMWEDIVEGTTFYSGAEGEPYVDVVSIVNSSNVEYQYVCIETHTKSSSRKPGTSGGNRYWQLGDKVSLVATRLLLAELSLIDNLMVKYLYSGLNDVSIELKSGGMFIENTPQNISSMFTYNTISLSKTGGSIAAINIGDNSAGLFISPGLSLMPEFSVSANASKLSVIMKGLPTTSSQASSGGLWNDNGTIKIKP